MSDQRITCLTFAGLANRSLEAYLALVLEAEDARVEVIRSYDGVANERVRYHCPSDYITESRFLVMIWKFLMTFRLALSGRFDAIYAIHSVPHLYLAYIASVISRKPLICSVIAGITEFKLHGRFFQRINEMIARRARLVIIHKESTERYLQRLGLQKKNIVKYRMLNLVALRVFYPMKVEKTIDIVVISMLLPDKHINISIDIVAKLKESFPNIQAGIVGDGPLMEELKEYTISKGLEDNITFFGYISDSKRLNEILNASQVFVLNSSHEGGPFSIVESMNAGVCCVASRVGEVPFRIQDGHNGFIVDKYDDVDTYVSILKKLLENPGALREFQRRAAETRNEHPTEAIDFWRTLVKHLSEGKVPK